MSHIRESARCTRVALCILIGLGSVAQAAAEVPDPTILRCVPAPRATGVSLDIGAITIVFAQPMRAAHTLGRVPGLPFPPLAAKEPQWATPTTFVLQVARLQPATRYGIQLNSDRRKGFATADGHPLPPTQLTFTTAGRAATPALRITNIVDDFLLYHDAAKPRNHSGRVHRWNALLEAKHPTFFRDAIYRRKQGDELTRYKASCIRRFWDEVAPRIPAIRRVNATVEQQIRDTVATFAATFPDFDADRDFYVTISLSFRGKVVTVGDKDVFALGLDYLDKGGPQIPITIAHELYHLFHFQTFDAGGGLYRILWAEGLASYASSIVVPGHPMSTYLEFPAAKMNRCRQLLPTLAKQLGDNLASRDHRLRRTYFGAEANDTPIPPEAGYYVGYLIAEHLAKATPLIQLTRLRASQVYPILEKDLSRLATSR